MHALQPALTTHSFIGSQDHPTCCLALVPSAFIPMHPKMHPLGIPVPPALKLHRQTLPHSHAGPRPRCPLGLLITSSLTPPATSGTAIAAPLLISADPPDPTDPGPYTPEPELALLLPPLLRPPRLSATAPGAPLRPTASTGLAAGDSGCRGAAPELAPEPLPASPEPEPSPARGLSYTLCCEGPAPMMAEAVERTGSGPWPPPSLADRL